nr:hypothetical protein [Tanacetum cinerariifolium]
MYPEYILLEDEYVLSAEEQPLPPIDSSTAESPGGDDRDNDGDSSRDDDDDEDEEDEEEEEDEHLDLADAAVVVPTAHSIGLSQAVHYELQTHREQAELLALREQRRRARQPGLDARPPDHQDASRDADSHI